MVIPSTVVDRVVRVSCAALLLIAAGTLVGACGSDDAPSTYEGNTVTPGETTVHQALDEATASGEACVPDCDGKQCGSDGCFGQCGVCEAGTTCADGQCVAWSCQPDCTDRECGGDGCGGSCGTCSGDTFCLETTGTCNVADPCKGITFEGCCDGATLQWCQGGALESLDCATDGCGWAEGEYNCGGVGSDPTGEFMLSCTGACDCTGKACGDDGCGGSCGECGEGSTCDATGACVEDDCFGITFDGCCDGEVLTWCEGGVLETIDCSDNASCGWSDADGYYNCGTDGLEDPGGVLPLDCGLEDGGGGDPDPPEGCGDITDIGCCDGATLTWCEGDEVMTLECDSVDTCGWNATDVYYDCGTDGSEEPTGDWPKSCDDGGGPVCTPDCGSAQCGDDGCGGSCGQCGDGAECETGMCVAACEPACDGKSCGDDGCGGSCGTCGGGMACDEEAGTCSVPCDADCEGKQCGDDGCGGSCGDCIGEQQCTEAGLCEAPDPCEGYTLEGCCDGTTVRWCEDDEVWEYNCADDGQQCGWSADIDGYDCAAQANPDPSGTFPLACE